MLLVRYLAIQSPNLALD